MLRNLFQFFTRTRSIQQQPSTNTTTKPAPLFKNAQHTRLSNFNFVKANIVSAEPVTYVDLSNPNCGKVLNEDNTYSEIGSFEKMPYQQFVELLSGEVTLTLGARKACWPGNPFDMTHAVMLVQGAGYQGVFGYQQIKGEALFINDLIVTAKDDVFIFYDGTKISADAAKAKLFIEDIAQDCKEMPFTAFTNNCYTPLVTNFAQAESKGFKTSTKFRSTLFESIPKEQNYGFGTARVLGMMSRN